MFSTTFNIALQQMKLAIQLTEGFNDEEKKIFDFEMSKLYQNKPNFVPKKLKLTTPTAEMAAQIILNKHRNSNLKRL